MFFMALVCVKRTTTVAVSVGCYSPLREVEGRSGGSTVLLLFLQFQKEEETRKKHTSSSSSASNYLEPTRVLTSVKECLDFAEIRNRYFLLFHQSKHKRYL